MRCSANGASLWHKVTFSPEKTVPQAEPTPHHRLRAELSRCGSVRRGSRSPPETDSLPRPCFAALKGEAKVGVVPRGSPSKQVLPRTRKLSPLCTTSLLFGSPGLPVLRGVSGGGAALSSLCRRFPGGDIMNLTSRRSPLSGLSFSLFFFLWRKKKRLLATQSQNLCYQIKFHQNPT